MAIRTEELAANGRVVSARFPLRELVAIVVVVFTAIGTMIVGMQWAVSTNVMPLFLVMQEMQSQVRGIHEDVDGLRSDVEVVRSDVGVLRSEVGALHEEVGKLRTEVEGNRSRIVDLRERVAKVEVGLAQMQANQARILELLDRGRPPRE